jgi:hypothetical protein
MQGGIFIIETKHLIQKGRISIKKAYETFKSLKPKDVLLQGIGVYFT